MMTTVQQRTAGFAPLVSGGKAVYKTGLNLSPEKAMPIIEEGAVHKASGSGGYQIDMAALNLNENYANFNSLGENGSMTTFNGFSERFEKAAHGNVGNMERIAALSSRFVNAVKAPFKPKEVKIIKTGNAGKGSR